MPGWKLIVDWVCKRLYHEKEPNLVQIFLLKNFSSFIRQMATLSEYERGLSYAAKLFSPLCTLIIMPFGFLIIELTFAESKIFSDIFVNSYSFTVILLMSAFTLPVMIWLMLVVMQIFDLKFKFGLMKILQMNHFVFRNRKVKWLSDIFRLNPTIENHLKQYENFHFSSQLYFILFSLSLAGFTIVIGLKIIFENTYICFMDPAMMIIMVIVWLVGDLSAMIISFLALKMRFYEKK